MKSRLSTVRLPASLIYCFRGTRELKSGFNWIVMPIIIIFYLLIAYNSTGYHQYDEHFQIIEFANYKSGKSSASNLAWEYGAKIRSGLQPMTAFLVFSSLDKLGIKDPYYLAFILRAFTAIFFILAMSHFVQSTQHLVAKRYTTIYFFLSYFLWFIPYLNVRFSSEGWSGILLLIAIGTALNDVPFTDKKKMLVIGSTLALAVLCRYQTAIVCVSILSWMILIKRTGLKPILLLCSAIAVVLILGQLIDHWLYGIYTFPPYNYFYVNLIKGVASQYGVSPWYKILSYILFSPGPFGPFIIIALIVVTYKYHSDLLVWTIVPFVVAHMLIPHKETRFLFPLANFVPLLLFLAGKQLPRPTPILRQAAVLLLVPFAALVNICGLYFIATNGSGNGMVAVTGFLHHLVPAHEKATLKYIRGLNPYVEWKHPKDSFYPDNQIDKREINSIWEKDALIPVPGQMTLLILSQEELTGPKTSAFLSSSGYYQVYENTDPFSRWIQSIYNFGNEAEQMAIFQFRGKRISITEQAIINRDN